jgi:hypothetical protein
VAATIFLLAAGLGVRAVLPDPSARTHLVLSVGLAVCVTLWCALDARARGRPLLWPVRLALFVAWPVVAPVYLGWAQGGRGLVRAVGYGAAFIGVAVAAAVAAQAVGFGEVGGGRR